MVDEISWCPLVPGCFVLSVKFHACCFVHVVSCMKLHTCNIHVTVKHVCYMYATCMLHVCYMYATFMYETSSKRLANMMQQKQGQRQ